MVPTGLYFVQHLEIIGNPWKNQVNLSRGEEQASYCRNRDKWKECLRGKFIQIILLYKTDHMKHI